MTDYTLEQVMANGLGDCSVTSIVWEADGNDLCLGFSIPNAQAGSKKDAVVLRFIWAHEVVIDFDFGRYMGYPFVFSASFAQEGAIWRVEVRFGGQPEGCITLKCQEIRVEHRG